MKFSEKMTSFKDNEEALYLENTVLLNSSVKSENFA